MIRPYIERDCIIEHEGRKFESGGAIVTDDYIVAYPGKGRRDGMGVDRIHGESRDLNDWHGNKIGSCRFTSSWRIPNGWQSSHMFQIYATVDGVRYTGRGMGEGMICRLRHCARQA